MAHHTEPTSPESNRASWKWIAAAATVIFAYNLGVGLWESTGGHWAAHIYSAFAPFAGGYTALPGQADSPTGAMSFGLISALALTSGSLIAAYFSATKMFWAKRKAARTAEVVVLGDSEEAGFIAASARGAGHTVFHAGADRAPFIIGGHSLYAAHKDPAVRKAMSLAHTVIVTDKDFSSTGRISHKLVEELGVRQADLIQIVSDDSTQFGGIIRPPEISGTLPPSSLVSPGDNLGQLVSELLFFLAPAKADSQRSIAVWSGISNDNVTDWVANTIRAHELMTGRHSITLTDSLADADVAIIDQTNVKAFNTAFNHCDHIIALFPPSTFKAMPWIVGNSTATDAITALREKIRDKKIYSIDPHYAGYNFHVLKEDVRKHWARSYHIAHSALFAESAPWTPDEANYSKNEWSSLAAVEFMLENLNNHGFALTYGAPNAPMTPMTPAEAESLGRAEHDSWRSRTWTDNRGRTWPAPNREDKGAQGEFTVPNALDVPWEELPQSARDYNANVPLTTYPALAALYGYGITRAGTSGQTPPAE